jgi:hypothetical protein
MNTSPFHSQSGSAPLSRRDFLWQSGGGLGGVALASMFGAGNTPEAGAGEANRPPSFGRTKRVVQFFMAGAASHLDLFDFKPELIRHHGKAE